MYKLIQCSDLVVTSYGMYLMDQKCRATFTNATTAEALVILYSYGLSVSNISYQEYQLPSIILIIIIF